MTFSSSQMTQIIQEGNRESREKTGSERKGREAGREQRRRRRRREEAGKGGDQGGSGRPEKEKAEGRGTDVFKQHAGGEERLHVI